jgi:1,4-alpha-glucan branching enzyme
MWTLPGKKLLFMGSEFGDPWEWDFRQGLPWWLTQYREHAGVQRLVGDLNRLYVREPALHRYEFEPRGFSWLDCNDAQHSTLSFARWSEDHHVIVALNFTPVPRDGFRIGAPYGGRYRVLLNSDSEFYGGSNLGNGLPLQAEPQPWSGQPHSLVLTLPPLGAVILAPE